MTKTLIIPFLILAVIHIAWRSPNPDAEVSTTGCSECYTNDIDMSGIPSGITFEGSNSDQRRKGQCTITSSCKGTSDCKYWGLFKIQNSGSDDRWIEIPGGGRIKASGGQDAEIYFSEDEGFTVPCRGQGDAEHDVHGATREFKIFDKQTGGESLGKVVYACDQCQQGGPRRTSAVERYLEDPLSEEILRGRLEGGYRITSSMKDGQIAFDFEELPKPQGTDGDGDGDSSPDEQPAGSDSAEG